MEDTMENFVTSMFPTSSIGCLKLVWLDSRSQLPCRLFEKLGEGVFMLNASESRLMICSDPKSFAANADLSRAI
jgi:hypothetical protein